MEGVFRSPAGDAMSSSIEDGGDEASPSVLRPEGLGFPSQLGEAGGEVGTGVRALSSERASVLRSALWRSASLFRWVSPALAPSSWAILLFSLVLPTALFLL